MRKHPLKNLALFITTLLVSLSCLGTPKVVVTLKPIHSLVSSLMMDVGEPTLLLPDGASPHTFQLKPSMLKQLQQADMVIWVGPELELFMIKPLAQIHPQFGIITLMKVPHLSLLVQRQDKEWQHHHGSDAHEHKHEHEHEHDHEGFDPHIWLSTDNAKVIVHFLANHLSKIDPVHAKQYRLNENKLITELNQLKITLDKELAPVRTQPFLVYHDGYQYFEKEFKLNALGTLILNPHVPLSAKSLFKVKQLIKEKHIQCVFRETEFHETFVQQAFSDMPVKIAELDPLGVRHQPGPKNYQNTLLAMGQTLSECLAPETSN